MSTSQPTKIPSPNGGIRQRVFPQRLKEAEPTNRFGLLHRLVYLYFWLLIFEGVLRKWILPQYSDYLLVIRDPVAFAILLKGISKSCMGSSKLVIFGVVLAFLFFILGLVQSMNGLNPLIMAYGYRTYFLHLPVMFIMGNVLSRDDIKRICRWVGLVAVGMVPLLILQFFSAPDSFVNTVAGGEGVQIDSAMGRIRTPGVFTFILGLAYFYALVLAIAMAADLEPNLLPRWLKRGMYAATAIVAAVAGSRFLIVSFMIVLAGPAIAMFIDRRYYLRSFRTYALAALTLALISTTSIFRSGAEVLNARVTEASAGDNPIANLLFRTLNDFADVKDIVMQVKPLGVGIGLGTNAGSKLMIGDLDYLVAENEWPRIILESGAILGAAYIFWRLSLVLALLVGGIREVRSNNIFPFMLWFACAPNLLIGQWGPPTNLGFGVFVAGLALAALRNGGSQKPERLFPSRVLLVRSGSQTTVASRI